MYLRNDLAFRSLALQMQDRFVHRLIVRIRLHIRHAQSYLQSIPFLTIDRCHVI